ncbi:MAG: hypothetical protein HW413_2232 [Thermoleophilia bacterium]|nr:hypothetical protein [Thermoleophilia bacterium]
MIVNVGVRACLWFELDDLGRLGMEGAGLEPEPIARSQRLSIVHPASGFQLSAAVPR